MNVMDQDRQLQDKQQCKVNDLLREYKKREALIDQINTEIEERLKRVGLV